MSKCLSSCAVPVLTDMPTVFKLKLEPVSLHPLIFDNIFTNSVANVFDRLNIDLSFDGLQKIDSLSEKADNWQPVLNAIFSDRFALSKPKLKKIFLNSDQESLDEFLQLYFNQAAKQSLLSVALERATAILQLVKVEEIFKETMEATLPDYANRISGPAAREQGALQLKTSKNSVRLTTYYLKNAFNWIVDTLQYITLLKNITDGDASEVERQMIAAMQVQAMRENIAMIATWVVGLAIYTGSIMTAALITLAVALPVTLFSVVYVNYFKPAPSSLHPMTNLKEEAIKGSLNRAPFRDRVVEKIVLAIQNNAKNLVRRFPIIIGKSGVGKSSVFNSLAANIVDGKVTGPLKNSTVYHVNARELVSGQGETGHRELIINRLKGYEKDAIICMDEIKAAFETDSVLAELLLSDMDNIFPHLVFACTDKEYEELVAKNESFARRLDVIKLESLKPQKVLPILYKFLTDNYPYISFEDGSLNFLANISETDPTAPQPFTALKILEKAVNEIIAKQFQGLQGDLNSLLAEQSLQDMSVIYAHNNGRLSDLAEKDLSKQIEVARQNQTKLSQDLDKLHSLLAEHRDLLHNSRDLSLKIGQKSSEKDKKQFALQELYLQKSLQKQIDKLKKNLEDFNPVITLKMVQELYRNEAPEKEDVSINVEEI